MTPHHSSVLASSLKHPQACYGLIRITWRILGSERTSLADAISMNFFSATSFSFSSVNLSGCHCIARSRYLVTTKNLHTKCGGRGTRELNSLIRKGQRLKWKVHHYKVTKRIKRSRACVSRIEQRTHARREVLDKSDTHALEICFLSQFRGRPRIL